MIVFYILVAMEIVLEEKGRQQDQLKLEDVAEPKLLQNDVLSGCAFSRELGS